MPFPFQAFALKRGSSGGTGNSEGMGMFTQIYVRFERKLKIGFFALMFYAAMC